LFKHTDSPLPLHGRRIDALLHQIFVAPVLMTGRGPMANGLPVPSYTSNLTDALDLIELHTPGRNWGIERMSGRNSAWIADRDDLPYIRTVFEDHEDLPIAAAVVAAMVESANEEADSVTRGGMSTPNTLIKLAEAAQAAAYPFGERLTLEEALRAPEPALEAPEEV